MLYVIVGVAFWAATSLATAMRPEIGSIDHLGGAAAALLIIVGASNLSGAALKLATTGASGTDTSSRAARALAAVSIVGVLVGVLLLLSPSQPERWSAFAFAPLSAMALFLLARSVRDWDPPSSKPNPRRLAAISITGYAVLQLVYPCIMWAPDWALAGASVLALGLKAMVIVGLVAVIDADRFGRQVRESARRETLNRLQAGYSALGRVADTENWSELYSAILEFAATTDGVSSWILYAQSKLDSSCTWVSLGSSTDGNIVIHTPAHRCEPPDAKTWVPVTDSIRLVPESSEPLEELDSTVVRTLCRAAGEVHERLRARTLDSRLRVLARLWRAESTDELCQVLARTLTELLQCQGAGVWRLSDDRYVPVAFSSGEIEPNVLRRCTYASAPLESDRGWTNTVIRTNEILHVPQAHLRDDHDETTASALLDALGANGGTITSWVCAPIGVAANGGPVLLIKAVNNLPEHDPVPGDWFSEDDLELLNVVAFATSAIQARLDAQEAAEERRSEAEASRRDAERAKVTAEEALEHAEDSRRLAETASAEADSERAQAEEARREAEESRNRAEESAEAARRSARDREIYMGSLAHELKSPVAGINAIVGNLRLRLNHGILDAEVLANQVDDIRLEISRYFSLFDEWSAVIDLVLSRRQLARRAVPIRRLVDSVIEQIQGDLDAEQARLSIVDESGGACVSGDESALTHVMQNLLRNAIKYGRGDSGLEIEISIVRNAANLGVAVRDFGPGIDWKERNKLFMPFFRGKAHRAIQHGAGVGLYLVKEIVEKHGGTVALMKGADGRSRTRSGGLDVQMTLPIHVPRGDDD